MASEQVDEANATFTFKGEPIHPFLLGKFLNWMSDYRPPIVKTVDVSASYSTNEFQTEEIKRQENSWYFAERSENDRNYESMSYKWYGKMTNGVHVVEISENGGGSGHFLGLLFLRFSEGEIFWDEVKQKQLLMTIVGTY